MPLYVVCEIKTCKRGFTNYMLDKINTNEQSLEGEVLHLYYVPVEQATLWEDNPKESNIGDIINSIQKNGFRDPPAYDSTLEALVEGNHRSIALKMMETQSYELPRGIAKDKDGRWCMPILFGIDSKSRMDAQRYAIDHNNLTMSGGDFTAYDMARMWNPEKYKEILKGFVDDGIAPVSIDLDSIDMLLNGVDFDLYDDVSDKADDMIDDDTLTLDEGIVLKLVIENTSLVDDIKESIQELLDENPGWQATISG